MRPILIDTSSPTDFLTLVRSLEDRTESQTLSAIPELGVRTPACYELAGEVLYVLDAMGSCASVCDPKQHDITFLSGKASSYGRASLRLIQIGHYDESLLLTRSLGEIANLLTLFVFESQSLGDWRAAKGRFTPVKVRCRIEAATDANLSVGIDESTYNELSGRSAHIDRNLLEPNSFNPSGIPTTGGRYQEEGLIVCLNELCKALAYACWASATLLGSDVALHETGRSKGLALLRNVGGADLLGYLKFKRLTNTESDS